MRDQNFNKNFCPSPWFHMRIQGDGHMDYCRWAIKTSDSKHNIKDTTVEDFFQKHMTDIRSSMLNGNAHPGCSQCQQMEEHSKVSGRQKQLIKVGVKLDRFEKSLASSPWLKVFSDSDCKQLPQDWQIDLGNYCNSACVFCSPRSSSKLAAEWKKIGFIDTVPKSNWSEDESLLDLFINTVRKTKHIQYMHFIGGETLITPAFRKILEILIDLGINKTVTIGLTTNLTVWDNRIVNLLTQFNGVNLGVSIESFESINEYVRWPATMNVVNENLKKWVELSRQHNWLMQIRTTPTILTIDSLLSVYNYAWKNNIAIESCNFLTQPKYMKPSVMPLPHRLNIIKEMEEWVEKHSSDNTEVIVNTRNPSVARDQIVQDLQSYLNYLKTEPDESHLLPELMDFLKKIESNRGNKILNYIPKYEELFRSVGY